jgi:superfamily II DNA/RNA helicase
LHKILWLLSSNLIFPNQYKKAIDDLGFTTPTPIQEKSFSVIMSGRDMMGIAQTGTGKTLFIAVIEVV